MRIASIRRFALLITFSLLLATGCNDDPVDVVGDEDGDQSNVDEVGESDESKEEDEKSNEESKEDEEEPGKEEPAEEEPVEEEPAEEEPGEEEPGEEEPAEEEPAEEEPAEEEPAEEEPVEEEPVEEEPVEEEPGEEEPAEEESGQEASDSDDPMAFLDDIHTMGMWLWDPTGLLDNSGGARDELMSFMAAPHGHEEYAIDRLFMEARGYEYVDPNVEIRPVTYDPLLDPDLQSQMREFLQTASNQGVAVEYLAAQGIWLATDEYAEVPKQKCEDVVTFNLTTNNVDERFAGVHLDIEPFTVTDGPYADEYFENPGPGGYNIEWTQRWHDIMESCRETLDDYEAETGHQMTLSIDVALWAYYDGGLYDFVNTPDSPVDYITIMNYFDNRPNINGDPSYFYGDHDGMNVVGGVNENLEMWDQVPVMFAVETGPPEIAPPEWSFYENGYLEMFGLFDEYFDNYADTHAMGMAVHYYHPTAYPGLDP